MKEFHLQIVFLVLHYFTCVKSELFLADYTQNENISEWIESSDTVRDVGKSKAVISLQETQVFKRAVLFTLLNPQPCGAGFAGVNKFIKLDLTPYKEIKLKLRGQGQYKGFKFILRHRGEFGDRKPSYCHFFEAPENEIQEVSLSLEDFKPYSRGMPIQDNSTVLDKSQITSIGIQTYGGKYMPQRQSGVASLEIDWIKAV